MDNLHDLWDWFSRDVYTTARTKGWWQDNRSFIECIGLVYSELGEAVEAFRVPKCSAKILGYSHAAEELADVIIRIADLCKHFDLDPWHNHYWAKFHAHLFDTCNTGNYQNDFTTCIDVIMANSAWFDALAVHNPVEWLAFISAYLGEAVFGHIHGNGLDVEDSLGDVIIGVCGLARVHQINLGEAILAKHAYNQSRTYRHGAKLY